MEQTNTVVVGDFTPCEVLNAVRGSRTGARSQSMNHRMGPKNIPATYKMSDPGNNIVNLNTVCRFEQNRQTPVCRTPTVTPNANTVHQVHQAVFAGQLVTHRNMEKALENRSMRFRRASDAQCNRLMTQMEDAKK